jgi:hypothetical protein
MSRKSSHHIPTWSTRDLWSLFTTFHHSLSTHHKILSKPDFQPPLYPTKRHYNNMPLFYPYIPSAVAPTPTHNCNCAPSMPPFSLLTPTVTSPVDFARTYFSTLVSSHTIEGILHRISAADTLATPTSALDLTMKAEAPGSDGGGISTGATIGIIVAGIVLLFGIAFVVVKVLRY